MQPLIFRQPLRADVRRVLLSRLLSGEMEPGSRINEVQLASELGVSRTPLREALLHLEFEGFIESEQGKGFVVTQLDQKTAQDLHDLVGFLEAHAVRGLASLPPDELERILQELEKLNTRMGAAVATAGEPDPERLMELGDAWHALLVGGHANAQLHEILALLKARLFRYTYHFVGRAHRVEGTLDQHEEIVAVLRRGEFDHAAGLVKAHWMTGADTRYASLPDGER